MALTIILDTGVLGLVTHPRVHGDFRSWFEERLSEGAKFCVPEISDYELRRELIRADRAESVRRLDALEQVLIYLPLDTEIMRRAAELWARMRNLGLPTAESAALDGDVILASQAMAVDVHGEEMVVATDNVGHLGRMVNAKNWDEIR